LLKQHEPPVVYPTTWFVDPSTGLIPVCPGLARRFDSKGPIWTRHHCHSAPCHFSASWSRRTLIPWSISHQGRYENMHSMPHGSFLPGGLLSNWPSSSAKNQFTNAPWPSRAPSSLGILGSLITKAPSNQGTELSGRTRYPRSFDANKR
jgi:hypothetical protein